MPLDPLNPGAMPQASVTLTKAQLRTAVKAMEDYLATGNRLDSVRLEELRDAYARIVLIGPEGDPVSEQPLFPT